MNESHYCFLCVRILQLATDLCVRAQKFLLKIPGGLFGRELEAQLLSVLDLRSRLQQYKAIQR